MPEVLESENDDMIVENESPRGGKYNLRPNPTPTLLMNTDTSQIHLLPVPIYYFDSETNLTLEPTIIQIQ